MARLRERKSYRLCFDLLEDRLAPATFNVTNNSDAAVNGSLRQALTLLQNSTDATNTISIANNIGQISSTSTLQITRSVDIVVVAVPGGGAATPILGRSAALPQNAANPTLFSELTIVSGISVSISGLTIAGGFAQSGGGIHSMGALTLSNVTFRGNTATAFGGAIWVESAAGAPRASLSMTGCTVEGGFRRAQNGDLIIGADSGAGIYIGGGVAAITSCRIRNNYAADGGAIALNGGNLTLNSTTVSGNTATGDGGGIWIGGSSIVTLTNGAGIIDNQVPQQALDVDSRGGGIFLDSSTSTLQFGANIRIESNQAGLGGGIYNRRGAIVTLAGAGNGVNFVGNTARLNGGGILNREGQIRLSDANFTNNRANGTAPNGLGGGIYNYGTQARPSNVFITDVTALRNMSRVGGWLENGANGNSRITNAVIAFNLAPMGGGIDDSDGGTTVLVNSTVADNSATTGGGIDLQAAGIISLTNDTIAENSATTGGGIYAQAGASVTIGNTIVASNTDDVSGALTSNGNNLIGNTAGSSGWVSSDLLNESPSLEPLGFYGGDTETMPPSTGSPAIDAGNNALADAAGLTTDQRGLPRIVNSIVDIGAVEIQSGENDTFQIEPTVTAVVINQRVLHRDGGH